MDIFMEYIVSRKRGLKQVLAVVGILLALILLLTVSLFLMMTQFGSIVFMLDAGLIYLAYYGITCTDVEYEYTVTNGELDIDKIVHRRKRKRLITVHSKTFELVAPVGDPDHRGEENAQYGRVIDVASRADSDRAYFAVFSKDGQRTKLIFEPTDKMLEAFRTFVPRNVFKK